jgi:hypothetical protein
MLDLPVLLRVMRRAADVPDLEHPQIVFERMGKIARTNTLLR